jgi:hypothetical protein
MVNVADDTVDEKRHVQARICKYNRYKISLLTQQNLPTYRKRKYQILLIGLEVWPSGTVLA